MNLGVVIIYPRFKLKWADAADGKAECGAFSVCIESAFEACLLNYLPPLLVATLVAYTRTLTPDKPIIAFSFSLALTPRRFPLRNYFRTLFFLRPCLQFASLSFLITFHYV